MAQNSGLMQGLMQGKRGVILGVANNRSIAWGIAKACHAAGAELAFTYQGDALKKRVEPLAAEIGGLVLGHCDVTDAATIDAAFAVLKEKWGKIDFLVHAIAYGEQLDGRYVDTTQENFSKSLLISCYSFVAVAQRAEKMPGRLLAPGQKAGELTAEAAKLLGLQAGIPISAAIIDAHSGVPGAGVASPSTMVMVMGTSSCHMMNSRIEQMVSGICGVVEDGILPGYFGYETGQASVGDAFV